MAAAAVLLSIASFFAIVIGTWAGAGADGGFGTGVWPAIFVLPLIGLPIAMLLIIGLVVRVAVRRSRADKDAGK
jgi:hypothetical protein